MGKEAYTVRKAPVEGLIHDERVTAIRDAGDRAMVNGGTWEVWRRVAVIHTEPVVRDV